MGLFFAGFLLIDLAIAMVVGAFVLPDEARAGLIGAAIGAGIGGAVLMYLGWPSRRAAPAGKIRADAYVVDARLDGSEAVGYRMVEMTLDVRPEDAAPFQVTRKFVADMAGIETGQRLEVYYDPADPERVELA